ncbi:phosphatase PAP2 family protein [Jatrophihabitans telluris]|uniref:Phosphatase PAP2 family protein n=1 Tax=Jatrophihabitans telluris TaxID=2038343 RepID=A0ABY4QW37_9ACTN|nr:phosphatase PAP2 family protein [Jatrophihabitans telluris]UQX87482.1 phosphatase PAP2 family protein [Jatrophihabitans telluris]
MPADPFTRRPRRLPSQFRLFSPTQLITIRRTLLGLYALALLILIKQKGIPEDRNELFALMALGLIITGIGKRKVWPVIRDWLPFAVLLAVYDQTRGVADVVGRPTVWFFQARFDEALFFGHDPTVWLQSQLKQVQPPWWEVAVSTVYVSYYLSPYLVAVVWWLRDRHEWKKFVVRFVAMSFIGLAGFILMPAAPPWAAARCTAAQVAGGVSDPPCMVTGTAQDGDVGILGEAVVPHHSGAHAYVERVTSRGFKRLHLNEASALLETGQAKVNLVAAVPSLHAATTLLVSMFLWPRVRRRWRPLLVAYPLAMAFVLVYGAEHYVFDILLGWLITLGVTAASHRWDVHQARRRVRLNALAPPVAAGDGNGPRVGRYPEVISVSPRPVESDAGFPMSDGVPTCPTATMP